MTTSYAELYADIRDAERRLAYGSETAMWGDFLDRMRQLGISPFEPADQTIDASEAAWWREAYSRLEANPSVESLQEIYDSI